MFPSVSLISFLVSLLNHYKQNRRKGIHGLYLIFEDLHTSLNRSGKFTGGAIRKLRASPARFRLDRML